MTFPKAIDYAEDALIVGGVAVSLNMIYQILGIVILACQIVLILVKAGIKIYNLIKDKKVKEAVDAVNDAKDELEKLKEKTTDGKH